MKRIFCLLFATAMVCAVSSLQAQNRAPSPSAKLSQKVGLTDVTIEYSRPGCKDRTIFSADGLAPFGKLWRTGANSATKITFSDDVKIEGKEVAAGSYAVLTIPGETEWAVHLYKHEGTSWGSYREKDPDIKVMVEPVKIEGHIESFIFTIDNLRDYSATLMMVWESTMVPIQLTVS